MCFHGFINYVDQLCRDKLIGPFQGNTEGNNKTAFSSEKCVGLLLSINDLFITKKYA